jgi:acyl carrier protein
MAAPLSEITAILRDVLHDSDVDLFPTTRFDDLTDWDSMDLVNAVVEVECRYHLQIELSELDRLVTVGDLVRMVEAKRAFAPA